MEELSVPEVYPVRVERSGVQLRGVPLGARAEAVTLPTSCTAPAGSIALVRELGEKLTVERVAFEGSARWRVLRVLDRQDLTVRLPASVHTETASALRAPGLYDEVRDLTDLVFVTIDNEDSRDLDQAVAIERQGTGYVVSYALADASYYVRAETALMEESVRRGASFYLPELSVPMLPRALSEGLVSLNPGVLRRSLVFRVHLAEEGHTLDTDIVRARIRSRAKLSYNGVQAYFDDPASSPLRDREEAATLDLLREVGERLIDRAASRGMLRLQRRG